MANFLGNYDFPDQLERAHPSATTGDYANVLKSQTVFVFTGGVWVNSFAPIGTSGVSFEINGLVQTQQEINISSDPNSVTAPAIEHFVEAGVAKHEIKIPEAKTFGVSAGLVSKADWDLLQTLGDNYEYYEIFEVATSDTGTVTKPSQSIILLDRYADGVDAIITELDSQNFPIDSPARDSLGNVITTTFDADGHYELSATPVSPAVAIVYLIKIQAKYANNVTESQIVNKIGVSEEHYSNPNPTPYAVGGIPKGETFLNRTMTNMWDRLLYPITPTVYESIQFDAGISRPAHSEGQVYYDSQEKTLNYDTDVTGTSINIGQESVIKAVNKTGSLISNGSVVYISGATGNRPRIVLARADAEATADCVIGVTTSDIDDDAQGYVTTFGVVRGLDTQGLGEGSALWLSATSSGEFTATMPEAPYFPVFIGYVTVDHPTQGEILVNIQNHTVPALAVDGIHVPLIHDSTKDPTGFSNNSNITVSYSIANRTITLSGTFKLFWRGRVVLNVNAGSWESPAHTATPTGSLFLYYDGSAFIWSSTPWKFDLAQIAVVAFSSGGSFRFALKETHGVMAHDTHEDLHTLLGTFRKSGIALSNYTLASTTAANRRPDTSAGVIRDEDVDTVIVQQLKTDASYTIMSLTGSDAVSSFSVNNADIVLLSGNNPYYNQFTGGAWQQTLVPTNQYMTMWQLAVPVASDSTSQNYRLIWVQGQSAGTLSVQQALDPRALNLGTLSILTPEWVFVNRVILQYTAGNWRLTQVDRIDGTRFSQAASASGAYLTSVSRDDTLVGSGTPTSLLGVNPILPLTKIEPLTDGAGTLQITKIDGTSPLIYFDSTANAEKFGFLTASPVATKGGIDVSSGGLGIIVGAVDGVSTRADATAKVGRIGAVHYMNAEEPIAVIIGSAAAAANNIRIGGGSSIMNAATDIFFYTAANNTTVSGTERMSINSSGWVTVGSPTAISAIHIVHTDQIGRQPGYNFFVNGKSANSMFLDTQGTLGRLRFARYNASGVFVNSPFEMHNDTGMVYCNNGLTLEGIRIAPCVRPNLLTNSNFDFWQEATSLSSGTGVRRTSDGGFSLSVGTTYTPSRQAFTVGQTAVPNGPKYYKRIVTSSVAGAGNLCIEVFEAECLEVTANGKITFSVWLKADATKNISVEFVQRFGTGGSSDIRSIGVKKQQINSSWSKYTFTADMPSISGKTIGSTPGNIYAVIWFDAGSDFNSRTDSLGQQSGTFDIAQAKLEIGDYATDWEPYNLADELVKCQRYCEKSYDLDTAPGTATRTGEIIARMPSATSSPVMPVYFKVVKAYTPTLTYYSGSTGAANNILLGGTTDSSVLTTPGISQTQSGTFTISGTTIDGAVASYQFVARAYL